jgi:hypothetical protein
VQLKEVLIFKSTVVYNETQEHSVTFSNIQFCVSV